MITTIVGINWGDEGKGRIVDLFSGDYDVVARCQGGNNAGHTVINAQGKFILNLLPSGILRQKTVNVMGGGMVIDPIHLCGEIQSLLNKGISVTPKNLKISGRATLCLPLHKQLDILEEQRLLDKKFGSTQRGIAPAYADKYLKKALRIEDLCLSKAELGDKIKQLTDYKNLTALGGYDSQADAAEMTERMSECAEFLKDFICDTDAYMFHCASQGQSILLEGQLGALRDIEYGIYPYTTSSSTIAAYMPIGAGIPGMQSDRVVGVIKAYSSCVGEGPFAAELFGQEGDNLRKAGGEFGAATGRPRRVGAFDVPASLYGCRVQGATCLALTKLDVLSYLDKIPVCVAYEVNGKRTDVFATGKSLTEAKPVMEYLDGFQTDISACTDADQLPKAARDYIQFIERAVGVPIAYVSVGASRDQMIYLKERCT